MDIKELKKKEPFWQKWKISENGLLGTGSFGAVYRIEREEFQFVQQAALKVIAIPGDEKENKALLEQGMSREEIQEYYRDIVQKIYEEISCMALLKGKSNIISYEDYDVLEREDSYGYFILIRMELATALPEYRKEKVMQTKDILKLGLDLCKALMECQKHHIIHRDIKPANIFVSADGDYKLGDFGVAKITRGYDMEMSVKGSYSYMAPEVYYGKKGDERSDLYSLGLVLYMVSNQERLAFLHSSKPAITYSEKQQALQQRMHGGHPELPQEVPEVLGQVINRAISFDPEKRYASVEDFYEALKRVERELFGAKGIMYGSGGIDFDPLEKTVELFSASEPPFPDAKGTRTKKKKRFINMAVLAAMVCLIGGLGIYGLQKKYSINQAVIAKDQTKNQKEKQQTVQETNNENNGQEVLETSQVTPKVTTAIMSKSTLKGTEKIVVTRKPITAGQGQVTQPPHTEAARQVTQQPHTEAARRVTQQPHTEVPKVVTQRPYTEAPRVVTQRPHTEIPRVVTQPPHTEPPVQYASSMQIPGMLQLGKGRSVALPIEITPASAKFTVSSSNTNVVRVQGTTLQAQQEGRCDIRVKSGNLIRTCTIKVTEE